MLILQYGVLMIYGPNTLHAGITRRRQKRRVLYQLQPSILLHAVCSFHLRLVLDISPAVSTGKPMLSRDKIKDAGKANPSSHTNYEFLNTPGYINQQK